MADARPERPFRPDETRGADIYWLLEVTFAGRTFRWATQALEVLDDDGNTVVYQGGLVVGYEQSVGLFDESASDPSVSIDELMMPEDVDISELIEKGHTIERAPAELALWVSGRTYEQRWIRMKGYVTVPAYGSQTEPISFDIEPAALEDHATIPSAEMRVTAETWANSAEEDRGRYYPRVYGQPGLNLTGSDTGIEGGSPALYVYKAGGTSYIMVADRPTYLADGTADVEIVNLTALDSQTFDVVTTTDGLGRTVSIANVTVAGNLTVNEGDEYWARWDSSVSNAEGGIPNWHNDGAMTGAGDIIRHLLADSTVDVDRDRFRAIEDRLNQFRLDFYVDDPVSPWEFVQAHILPLLPVSLVNGPDGVYPVWWDRDATSGDAVATLDADRNLERVGLVQYERSRIANEITILYAPRSDDGKPYYRRTITGRDVGGDSDEVWTSLHARQSRSRYGERALTVDTSIVYSHETAGRILAWMARAYAFPWRTVEYRSVSGEHIYLQVGDVVTITDSELNLSSRVALVRTVRLDDTDVYLTLVLIDDPARDTRST